MIIERTQTVTEPAEIIPDSIRINDWFSYRKAQRFEVNRSAHYEIQDISDRIMYVRLDGYIDGAAILCSRVSVESVKPGHWL